MPIMMNIGNLQYAVLAIVGAFISLSGGGIFTVGVATGLTEEQIAPLCDAVVRDYRGFTIEALERIVEQKKERKNGQK